MLRKPEQFKPENCALKRCFVILAWIWQNWRKTQNNYHRCKHQQPIFKNKYCVAQNFGPISHPWHHQDQRPYPWSGANFFKKHITINFLNVCTHIPIPNLYNDTSICLDIWISIDKVINRMIWFVCRCLHTLGVSKLKHRGGMTKT